STRSTSRAACTTRCPGRPAGSASTTTRRWRSPRCSRRGARGAPTAMSAVTRCRVSYVDVDVHHGDGLERAFWDEPRVLTVSLHESGRYLSPGTGFPEDVGGPGADGSGGKGGAPPRTRDPGSL